MLRALNNNSTAIFDDTFFSFKTTLYVFFGNECCLWLSIKNDRRLLEWFCGKQDLLKRNFGCPLLSRYNLVHRSRPRPLFCEEYEMWLWRGHYRIRKAMAFKMYYWVVKLSKNFLFHGQKVFSREKSTNILISKRGCFFNHVFVLFVLWFLYLDNYRFIAKKVTFLTW